MTAKSRARKTAPAKPQENLNTEETAVKDFLERKLLPYAKVAAVVILVLAVLIAMLFRWNTGRKQEMRKAFSQLEQAQDATDLMALRDRFRGSVVGERAAFQLGRHHFDQKRFGEAAVAFSEFNQHYPKSHMLTAARIGEAYAYEADNKLKTAQETFVAAASTPALPPQDAANAWLGAGRCAEARDSHEDARRFYENAIAATDTGTAREQAILALRRLRVVTTTAE